MADQDHTHLHTRARERGVNPIVYWLVRAVLQPFFHIYFRLSRVGREHVPETGPVIFAANHRSFLDPFVLGTLLKRPLYYVAKQELFENKLTGWFLNSLGAFPVARGAGDRETIETAKAILARGGAVVIFPEGTRCRPGSLGKPKRGVGRLALEGGAPVVPVAVIGTEAIRKGWRIRPHKVRIRCGAPLRFPKIEDASPSLAAAVTERIWPCVMLQWEWLGGLPPLRRAAVIGAGPAGATAAAMLAKAGLQVQLGCRTPEQAEALASKERLELPKEVVPVVASDIELSVQDVVCLAVPARALPSTVAAYGEKIPERCGVLVLSKGLVPPLGTLPTAYVAERVRARAVACLGGPADVLSALEHGSSNVLACADSPFSSQLGDALAGGGFDVTLSEDVVGVELAGAAKDVAGVAAAMASRAAGPAIAGAAAGKVFAEVGAYAAKRDSSSHSFAGLAGTGDLIATVLSEHHHRSDALDSIPLLAELLNDAGVHAPTVTGLCALIEGEVEPESWTAGITAPAPKHKRSAKAA